MKELIISRERVVEAIENCPEAKKVLETLFPGVVKASKEFDFTDLGFDVLRTDLKYPKWFSDSAIQLRTGGEFCYKGFFLTATLNWRIETDESNCLVLIPTRK